MSILPVRNALIFVLLLFVSGSLFAEYCGPPALFASGFEDSAITTYNDPRISGPTGDGRNFTRVPSTGLDWLDLTITLDLSTNEVAARLINASDELLGLRYASSSEINLLLAAYGLPSSGILTGTDLAMAYVGDLGMGAQSENFFASYGIWPINPELSQKKTVNYECTENITKTGPGGLLPTSSSFDQGSFLVRPMPLPGVTTYNDPGISGPTDDGKNFTRIESQGLDWLDPTITLNLSTDEVAIRLNEPSDELFGLRYATTTEINNLLEFYGMLITGEIPDSDAGMAFTENFGRSEQIGDITRITALWPATPEISQSKLVSYNLKNQTTTTIQGGLLPSTKMPTSGSFLVRPMPPSGVTTYNDPGISGPTDDGMNFTRVESQGLDWLDLTITLNLSTDEIAARLGNSSDELFGLRYATSAEINNLLTLYGMPSVGEIPGSDAGMAFIGNFGRSQQLGDTTRIVASWPVSPTLSQIKSVGYNLQNQTSTTGQGGSAPSTKAPTIGNFLVRPIP
jgi:ribosomal protein L29